MLWAALSYSSRNHRRRPRLAPGVVVGSGSRSILSCRSVLRAQTQVARSEPSPRLHSSWRARFKSSCAVLTDALDTSLEPFADGQPVEMTAHVTRDGKFREGAPNEIRQSLDVETEEIVTENGQPIPVHSGVRLGIYSARPDAVPEGSASPAIHLFRYGERLRLPVKLKLPRNFRNPGAFDYQGYLAANGISALGSAKAEDVEVLPGFAGNRVELWRSHIHSSIIAKVHALWPPPQAALIDAMVIGEEAFIDRDTRVDFQRSGTYHILVVSGMNVTILAFVVFWTLRRLRLADVPATSAHNSLLRRLRLSHRSRSPRLARHTDVRHLSRYPPALPRARHGQRARSSRSRVARIRSPSALHRQFPDDVSLRSHRRRHRTATHRTHLPPLSPGPHPLGRRRLRSLAPSTSRPVPPRPAPARTATRALHRNAMVAAPRTRRDHHLPRRVRVAAGLSRNADGPGPPHGVLLSPRHHHRPSRERRRRSPHATSNARCDPDHRARLHLTPARKTSRTANHLRAAIDHRNRPRPGRPAPGRSSRSHAIARHDGSSFRRAGLSNVVRSPARAASPRRIDCSAPSLASISLRSPKTANPSRTPRSNFHRRR